jgi:hypothetical protein
MSDFGITAGAFLRAPGCAIRQRCHLGTVAENVAGAGLDGLVRLESRTLTSQFAMGYTQFSPAPPISSMIWLTLGCCDKAGCGGNCSDCRAFSLIKLPSFQRLRSTLGLPCSSPLDGKARALQPESSGASSVWLSPGTYVFNPSVDR